MTYKSELKMFPTVKSSRLIANAHQYCFNAHWDATRSRWRLTGEKWGYDGPSKIEQNCAIVLSE